MANERLDSENPNPKGYTGLLGHLGFIIGSTSMATVGTLGHVELQLDGQLQVVTERLYAMLGRIDGIPLIDRNSYFETDEYQQFMRYIQLCPDTNTLTRGSIDGALNYIHSMRKEINQQLQLLEQGNRTNYIKREPSIVALSKWLDSYAKYNPLPDFGD